MCVCVPCKSENASVRTTERTGLPPVNVTTTHGEWKSPGQRKPLNYWKRKRLYDGQFASGYFGVLLQNQKCRELARRHKKTGNLEILSMGLLKTAADAGQPRGITIFAGAPDKLPRQGLSTCGLASVH